jgi:Protein of unknown function (DUF3108)
MDLAWRKIAAMRGVIATLLGMFALAPSAAPAQVAQLQLAYNIYAGGIEVMQMSASFGLGPWNYQIDLDYHTTGLVGLLYRGQQSNSVRGVWEDGQAAPLKVFGDGVWRGQRYRTLIDYVHGLPQIKDLRPSQGTEREPVPPERQRNTVDTLSALVQLIRKVDRSGSCETVVHTYDGRRLLEIVAHTGGLETLEPTGRSIFSGPALRCDFEGRVLAGFLLGRDDTEHRTPLHGSTWLAQIRPGAPLLPVRIGFQTRWFGRATMYLTGATDGSERAETSDGKNAFPPNTHN